MYPEELRYSKDHEWIRVEGDLGRIGITDYAQKALGDVVYVELPEAGKALAKGDEAAVIESVKAAAELYAPMDGEVVEARGNEQVEYDGEVHTAANLFDALKEGYYGKF